MTYWNEPEPLAKIIEYSYDSILNLWSEPHSLDSWAAEVRMAQR